MCVIRYTQGGPWETRSVGANVLAQSARRAGPAKMTMRPWRPAMPAVTPRCADSSRHRPQSLRRERPGPAARQLGPRWVLGRRGTGRLRHSAASDCQAPSHVGAGCAERLPSPPPPARPREAGPTITRPGRTVRNPTDSGRSRHAARTRVHNSRPPLGLSLRVPAGNARPDRPHRNPHPRGTSAALSHPSGRTTMAPWTPLRSTCPIPCPTATRSPTGPWHVPLAGWRRPNAPARCARRPTAGG